MSDDNKKTLFYLHELSDYKVSSDDPDVRGWDVKDADNRVVGKVDNLLVNKRKNRVVYLDVEVDSTIIEANHDPYGAPANSDVHEFLNQDGENHLIIPIGLVRLNEDQKYVYTESINHQTFAETKRKERNSPVDREYETAVMRSYDRFGDPDKRKRELDRDSGKNFETRPDDTYKEDYKSEETRRKREKVKGDTASDEDDDIFYDRDAFDDSNFRRRGNDR